METVLITGATGFLGAKVTALFLAEGCRAVVLVRRNSAGERLKPFANHPRLVKIFLGEDDLKECFFKYKISAIIHTATCYGRNDEPWHEIAGVNLLLPLQLLLAGEQAGVQCFINADTFFNDKMSFASHEHFYVKTKKDFLAIVRDAAPQIKIKFFNLRIEQMYGPGDSAKKFIPAIIKELLSNAKNIELTNGDQKRDFIFVDDVARAFVQVFKSYPVLENYQEFGIGHGRSVSIKEAVAYLKGITKSGSALAFGRLNYRGNEIMDSRADLSANEKINWRAVINWRDGLQKTVDFFSA
ncbi:NAD(P)-dependent oxidoreductase [Patescibacteria group bacterium]|nr:MAG: NAD(P)-dependent oxidoreductase [Patescibacteria group bacterium]